MDITNFARKTIHHYYTVEGGKCVTDDPEDLGGLTGPGGITETVLRENKYLWDKHDFDGNIAEVPYSLTEEIYHEAFWCRMGLDQIEAISTDLCDAIFGWGINSGHGRPVEVLQQHVNAMNKKATLYPNMNVDRGFGPTTWKRLNDYVEVFKHKNGVGKLIEIILSCQAAFYLEATTERDNERNERFYDGWQNRVNGKRARLRDSDDTQFD